MVLRRHLESYNPSTQESTNTQQMANKDIY